MQSHNSLKKIKVQGAGVPGEVSKKKFPTLWRFWIRKVNPLFVVARGFEKLFRSVIWAGGRNHSINHVYLLSFPRSGNHWTRYILETITGYPTVGSGDGFHAKDSSLSYTGIPLSKKVSIKAVSREPIAVKRHIIKGHDSKNIPVVFLIRNPIHAIVSHSQPQNANFFDNIDRNIKIFLNICDTLDNWDMPIKFVFFEELITDDSAILNSSISELLDFIGIVDYEEILHDFVGHIDVHKEISKLLLTRKPVSGSIDWCDGDTLRAESIIKAEFSRLSERSKVLSGVNSYYRIQA